MLTPDLAFVRVTNQLHYTQKGVDWCPEYYHTWDDNTTVLHAPVFVVHMWYTRHEVIGTRRLSSLCFYDFVVVVVVV